MQERKDTTRGWRASRLIFDLKGKSYHFRRRGGESAHGELADKSLVRSTAGGKHLDEKKSAVVMRKEVTR